MDLIAKENQNNEFLQMTLKQLQDFYQANKEVEQNYDKCLKKLDEANRNKEELLLEV